MAEFLKLLLSLGIIGFIVIVWLAKILYNDGDGTSI